MTHQTTVWIAVLLGLALIYYSDAFYKLRNKFDNLPEQCKQENFNDSEHDIMNDDPVYKLNKQESLIIKI
jgi:hypothetical protein